MGALVQCACGCRCPLFVRVSRVREHDVKPCPRSHAWSLQKFCVGEVSTGLPFPPELLSLVFRREIGAMVVSPAWNVSAEALTTFQLPPVLEGFHKTFDRFYGTTVPKGQSRKLVWLLGEGSGVLSATIVNAAGATWAGELIVSPLQVRRACRPCASLALS